MRVEYTGPHDEIELPSLNVRCKRGQTVEVPDKTGLALVKQDVWKTAGTPVTTDDKKGAK